METAILRVATGFIALCLWLVARGDLARLRGMTRNVPGQVIGHRCSLHDSTRSYAPIYRFTAEDGTHEVIDQVYSGAPHPPVGSWVQLAYPHGRPDLARVPRPWLWVFVYSVLIAMLGLLVAKQMDWLPPG